MRVGVGYEKGKVEHCKFKLNHTFNVYTTLICVLACLEIEIFHNSFNVDAKAPSRSFGFIACPLIAAANPNVTLLLVLLLLGCALGTLLVCFIAFVFSFLLLILVNFLKKYVV